MENLQVIKENNSNKNIIIDKGEINMNNTTVQIFEGNKVEVFELNGQVLFNPYDVGNCLDISKSTIRDNLATMNEKQVVKLKNSDVQEMMNFRKLNNAGENFLTESGVVELIAKSRKATKEKKLELLKELNISDKNSNLIISYKEIEFINKLEKVLLPLNLKLEKQYSVLDYRLDGYIPKLNIAIEYDENDHKDYTYEKQELRQAKIEEELNCKFIRLSDKNDDEYNIGLVIKEIMGVR